MSTESNTLKLLKVIELVLLIVIAVLLWAPAPSNETLSTIYRAQAERELSTGKLQSVHISSPGIFNRGLDDITVFYKGKAHRVDAEQVMNINRAMYYDDDTLSDKKATYKKAFISAYALNKYCKFISSLTFALILLAFINGVYIIRKRKKLTKTNQVNGNV
jgi:hypothetical protein